MNCEQFREMAHDLVREEALDGVAIEDAFAHAESCDSCGTLLEEAETLAAALRSLAAQHACEQAPAHVETALLSNLRQKDTPAPASNYFRRLSMASAVPIAAAVILLISFGLHRNGTQPNNGPQPQTALAASANSANDMGVLFLVEDTGAETDGSTTEPFVPLSDVFDPLWLDDAAVVRVVLSRPALESFGLPLNETGEGHVVADLVVTNDGVPRAIRMVGW